jgi:hypothetical protein
MLWSNRLPMHKHSGRGDYSYLDLPLRGQRRVCQAKLGAPVSRLTHSPAGGRAPVARSCYRRPTAFVKTATENVRKTKLQLDWQLLWVSVAAQCG